MASKSIVCALLKASPAWNTNEVTLTFMPRLAWLPLALLKRILSLLNFSLLKYSPRSQELLVPVHTSVHLSSPVAACAPHAGADHPLCEQRVMVRESAPRQVDKKSGGPQGERGLEFSRRRKGQTFFPPLHSLGLYNNNVSSLRTVSGKNLLANPVILKCKLWECV